MDNGNRAEKPRVLEVKRLKVSRSFCCFDLTLTLLNMYVIFMFCKTRKVIQKYAELILFHCCVWQREECFAFSCYFGVTLLNSIERVLQLKSNFKKELPSLNS